MTILLNVAGSDGDTDQAQVHCELEQLQVNLLRGGRTGCEGGAVFFHDRDEECTECMAIEEVDGTGDRQCRAGRTAQRGDLHYRAGR